MEEQNISKPGKNAPRTVELNVGFVHSADMIVMIERDRDFVETVHETPYSRFDHLNGSKSNIKCVLACHNM